MLRIGVIGTGGIAGVHLKYLNSREDVEIVGLCDIDPDNLKRRREEFGGEPFEDFREMIERLRPDAVWLCTPPVARGEPLIACGECGIPVFCEKPVELDQDRAGQIAEALAERRARVQVGYVFRPMALIGELKAAMRDDRIHLVQSFYACGVSLSMGLPGWFYEKERGGGALTDQATHNLDLLRYLFGPVREVSAVASNPVHPKAAGYTIDEVIALGLVFESGLAASHSHTWVGDGWRNEMVVSGEKRLYRMDISGRRLTVEEKGETRSYQQEEKAIHHYEDAIFLEQVQSGDWSRNPCDYADGAATLRLTTACERALREGKKVTLLP